METVVEITAEDAQKIFADFESRGKRASVKPYRKGDNPYRGEILGWDFASDHNTTYRAPPTAVPWFPHQSETWPHRYMTTKAPVTLRKWNGNHPVDDNTTEVVLPVGTRVKIVMASRFGDVGITDDLTAEHGYHARIEIDKLTETFENFGMEA